MIGVQSNLGSVAVGSCHTEVDLGVKLREPGVGALRCVSLSYDNAGSVERDSM